MTFKTAKGIAPIACALALVFLMQLYLAFHKGVNWDEFFHFQHVYELEYGTLTRGLQIFYIHLLQWTIRLPLDPIDQLIIGRTILLMSELVIASSIYGLCRRFTSVVPSVLCVLAYVSAGYVFTQMPAYRPDGIAAALMMTALWIVGTRPLHRFWPLVTGILVALGMMCTIKSVFYAPAFLGLAYLRYFEERSFRNIFMFGVQSMIWAVISFAAFYAYHSSTLALNPVASSGSDIHSASETVFSAGLFPQSGYLLKQILMAPLFTVMLFISLFLLARKQDAHAEAVAMSSLCLPILTVIFYRNSYAYNYVFILAPAAVALYPAAKIMLNKFGAVFVSGLFLVQPLIAVVQEPYEVLDNQRQITEAARLAFPEPITYVDFSGVLSGYPRVYPFLTSGWGLQRYRQVGEPLLAKKLQTESVPLVIANDPVLEAALRGIDANEMLLPQDVDLLNKNYIRHWGPIWVAGYHVDPGTEKVIDVTSSGWYSVEGDVITIDGEDFEPGDTVHLAKREIKVSASGKRRATLRWGKHLVLPKTPPPLPASRGMFGDY